MKYKDLRDFIAQLEAQGELKRIAVEVDPAPRDDRDLRPRAEGRRAGVAVREARRDTRIPVLGNLFGTPPRVAMGDGRRTRVAGAARDRQAARVPEGARAAEGPEGRLANTLPVLHAGARHGAEGALARALPGNRAGKARTSTSRGCRSRPAGPATPGR